MPEPPGPVSVSSRRSESSVSTSATSRPRPTKLESCSGRLFGGRPASEPLGNSTTQPGLPAVSSGTGCGVSGMGCCSLGVPLRLLNDCSRKQVILEETRASLTRAELLRSPSRRSSQNDPSVSFGIIDALPRVRWRSPSVLPQTGERTARRKEERRDYRNEELVEEDIGKLGNSCLPLPRSSLSLRP